MIRVAVLVVAAIGLGVQPGLAQAPKETPPAEQSATKTYLREAAIADMFGVESGKLAVDKSTREEVREFARATIADRADGLRKLKDLTGTAQLEASVPKAVDKVHETKLDELRKAEESDFDRTYLAMQVKAYETAITLHSAYSRATQDGPLKSHAGEMADLLQRRLGQLRQLSAIAPARS